MWKNEIPALSGTCPKPPPLVLLAPGRERPPTSGAAEAEEGSAQAEPCGVSWGLGKPPLPRHSLR